ncbi:MAG: type II toxin-antitoxin system RelE/ParE family toxin [Pseudomonadota bacterium]
MRRLDVSPLAQADFYEIADFSSWNFGHKQTDRYLEDFDEIFLSLLEFPRLGKTVHYDGREFHRVRCGSHYAYYVFDDELLRVLRVIHISRDQAEAMKAVP